MFCPKCGTDNLDTNKFCRKCGKQLPSRAQIGQMAPQGFRSPQPQGFTGQVIDGKYQIEAKLGSGGMGDVYRATRRLMGDTVAIKILHPHLARDPQAAERFRREAVMATKLRHRNVVGIYDVGISNAHNVPYILMELAEGYTLRQIINQYGKLPLDFAVTVVTQVCSALDEAHSLGIVHRDIKPENIVANQTTTGWYIKVLDFGIAKLYNQGDIGLTQDGNAMGTPQYMSPEQCLGEPLDARSDIYSVGIMLYEMLTGTVPFKSPTASAIAIHQVNTAPQAPRLINDKIHPEVEHVILKSIWKQREYRQQKASELAQELIKAATVAYKSGFTKVTGAPIPAPDVEPEFDGTAAEEPEPEAAPEAKIEADIPANEADPGDEVGGAATLFEPPPTLMLETPITPEISDEVTASFDEASSDENIADAPTVAFTADSQASETEVEEPVAIESPPDEALVTEPVLPAMIPLPNEPLPEEEPIIVDEEMEPEETIPADEPSVSETEPFVAIPPPIEAPAAVEDPMDPVAIADEAEIRLDEIFPDETETVIRKKPDEGSILAITEVIPVVTAKFDADEPPEEPAHAAGTTIETPEPAAEPELSITADIDTEPEPPKEVSRVVKEEAPPEPEPEPVVEAIAPPVTEVLIEEMPEPQEPKTPSFAQAESGIPKLFIAGGIAAILFVVFMGAAIFVGYRYFAVGDTAAALPESQKTASQLPGAPDGMAYVPGGEFMMGSDTGEADSKPAHKVTVKPFFMDITEVTNEAYKKFVDETRRESPKDWKNGTYPEGKAKFPVIYVSWDDATAFAKWAGKRLPTEEEWEFAARGTDGRTYPWGSEWNADFANANGKLQSFREVGLGDGKSPFGMLDMVGNAWEWTSSKIEAYPGGKLSQTYRSDSKVMRGGNFESKVEQATTFFRIGYPKKTKEDYKNSGFRCAKDIP